MFQRDQKFDQQICLIVCYECKISHSGTPEPLDKTLQIIRNKMVGGTVVLAGDFRHYQSYEMEQRLM